MDKIYSILDELLMENSLQPKVLLGASHFLGNQQLESVARRQFSMLNVSVQTLESLALDRAKLRMAEEEMTYLSGTTTTWLIHRLLIDLSQAGNSLLQAINLTPGIVRAFQNAVADLRNAGVQAKNVEPSSFDNPAKGELVTQLLHAYEEHLKEHRFADYAGMLQLAIEELTSVHIQAGNEPLYLLQRSLQTQFDAITSNFILTLARTHLVEVFDDLPEMGNMLHSDIDAAFFHAAGSLAEAREVFRRILSSGIPFDEVEIVATSSEEVQAVHTIAKNLNVPIRFSQGLPMITTRMGQLAYVFLDWVSSNYDISHILGAMREGMLRIPDDAISSREFVQALAEANIGWDRARYLPVLQRNIEQHNAHHTDHPHHPDKAQVYARLHDEFEALLNLLPEPIDSLPSIVTALDYFLSTYGRVIDERDGQALSQIRDLQRSLNRVPSFQLAPEVVFQYLREFLDGIRVDVATRPEPSAIYVTSIDSGSVSHRRSTYVLGMSESAWSLSSTQDPILLDDERTKLHSSLAVTEDKIQNTLQRRRQFFGRLQGKVTFSYSALNVVDGQQVAPAAELLQVYRVATGEPTTDYSQLAKYLGEPIGYAGRIESVEHPTDTTRERTPFTVRAPLDEVDLWLSTLLTPQGLLRDGVDTLLNKYEFLLNGHGAGAQRDTLSFTEFDGLIHTTLGMVEVAYYSPTVLEELAKCPRQYLYKRILKISPQEETEFDRNSWLDPLQRGSLYHQVFEDYMSTIVDGLQHDEHRLIEICNQVLDSYAETIPAPSPHVLALEQDEIRAAMKKFFSLEKGRASVTKFLEQEIGSREHPFAVDLGEGTVLPLFGKVDRVDEIAPHQYKVYDYKTGSDWGYDTRSYFKSGQRLQHALYAIAVEQWLQRERIDETARVTESTYVFPTPRAKQDEVTYRQDRREDVRTLVQTLISIPKQGLFVATEDAGTCKFCDFAPICGGTTAQQSKEKREALADATLLEPVLEVTSYE